jgi:hypothetical protein
MSKRTNSCKRDNSMLTFETESVGGASAIVDKLSVCCLRSRNVDLY